MNATPIPEKRRLAVMVRHFWEKVDRSGECWIWTGARTGASSGDYGAFWHPIRHAYSRAHRVAYEIQKGEIPPEMVVCHSCDNRLCVRGDHLFLGTHADNTNDCITKKRNAFGERHGGAKLTEDDVRAIREQWENGTDTMTAIGKAYGVSMSLISQILRRELWAHVL